MVEQHGSLNCHECGKEITVDNVEKNEEGFECPSCGAGLNNTVELGI